MFDSTLLAVPVKANLQKHNNSKIDLYSSLTAACSSKGIIGLFLLSLDYLTVVEIRFVKHQSQVSVLKVLLYFYHNMRIIIPCKTY